MSKYSPPTPPALPLPSALARVTGAYWRPSADFLDDLSQALQGRKVLEIFAGNGYLAGLLAKRGIDITATSLLTGMDAHERGIYHPVRDLDALSAVKELGAGMDVLLMCWPTTTPAALRACEAWGAAKDIAYIGEFTDYSRNHLGGCATDEFFEALRVDKVFDSYEGSLMEKALIGRVIAPAPELRIQNRSDPAIFERAKPPRAG